MATIHLAMDAETGLTLPLGQIKGMSDSKQGLRDAGFAADPYTGTRITTIDDTASDWNADAQPGWLLLSRTSATDYALGTSMPRTDLDDLRDAWRAFQRQAAAWGAELTSRGIAQEPDKSTQVRERLRHALGAMYNVCHDTSLTATVRKGWATSMLRGPAGVTKVDDFYTTDTTVFPPTDGASYGEQGRSSRWFAWVDPTDPGTRLALPASVRVDGTVPANVNLLDPALADDLSS